MQKRSKNEVAQKIPKKLPKIFFTRRATEPEGHLQGRPTSLRRPHGAAWGGPVPPPRLGDLGTALDSPLAYIFTRDAKNPRYPTHFSRSDPDLCRHRNLASGVTRILLRHPAEEGLGPRGHLHQPFFTPWCFLSSSPLDYGFLAVAMWYLLPLDLQYKVLMSCPTWLRSIWCNWCCVCWDPMNCYLVQS